MSAGAAPDRADRRGAAWLGLACALLYALFAHGHWNGTDEVGVFEQTRSLYERGALDVPRLSHAFPGRGGRPYSQFSIGQSLLALPFYAAGDLLADRLPPAFARALAGPPLRTGPHRFGGEVTIAAVGLYAPTASGALVALFFLLSRALGASRRGALRASALLAATTYVATHSVYFLRHTSEAALVLGSLLAVLHFERSGRAGALAAGAALLCALPLLRAPAALFVPAVVALALHAVRERARGGAPVPARQLLWAAGAPAALALALHLAVETAKWGSPFATPFALQLGAFGNPLAAGLAGFLLSPGCSVFVYSPLLLAAPPALRELGRRRRALRLAVLALCATGLLVYAKFEAWTGLYSAPGPRYLLVATPLLLLPLGLWLDAPGRGAAARRRRLAWALSLGAVGAAVQLALLLASWGAVVDAMDYRSDPQKSFVYSLSRSPVAASWRLLLAGEHLDPWLLRLARGWPGQPARPGAAALLFGLGLGAAGLCLRALNRALRPAPAPPAGSPAPPGRAG